MKIPFSFNHKTLIVSGALVFMLASFLAIRSYYYGDRTFALSSGREIIFQESGFVPAELVIKVGDTVKFSSKRGKLFWPASDLHPTHEIYSLFDPKKALSATSTWTFTFTRVGEWNFHDHLAPNFTGVIRVVGKDGALPRISRLDCSEIAELGDKEACWNAKLKDAADNKGLEAAFKLFERLYATEPSVPKSCHGWAHVLGRAAYGYYEKNKEVTLGKETTYCGYGFFHGFMEQMLYSTGDIRPTKDFCEYASQQLGDKRAETYQNCIHGIGHGSIDVDDVSIHGDFQAMVETGLQICDTILTDPTELRECHDGAFNAMSLYAYRKDYGLDVDMTDPYAYCRRQEQKHKLSCYFEFTGLTSLATGHNFLKAADLVLMEDITQEIQAVAIQKMAADFMQTDISNPSQEKNVDDCRSLPEHLRQNCFNGITIGFIAHGTPGKQYESGLAFCGVSYLTPDEKKFCYQAFLSRFVAKGSPLCQSVEEEYQRYCKEP